MDNTADVMMTGQATNNYFGRSVSTAGDVNGDGYSMLLSEHTDIQQIQEGHIYITVVLQ